MFFDMPGYVRISIGRPEDNAQAITALTEVFTRDMTPNSAVNPLAGNPLSYRCRV